MKCLQGTMSRCKVTSCLLQQTQVVAAGLNTISTVTKVARCSELGPILADLLSKGRREEFDNLHPAGPGREWFPRPVPEPLVRWIREPKVDHNLGRKILGWMKDHGTAPGAVLSGERPKGGTEMEAMDYFDIDV